MQPLAFVDLETTGATAAVDRITEIGIVEVDESGVREWSQLVNPEAPIPAFIQRMTGITDDMVRDAPTFDRLAAEVLDRLQGRLFIAHNARFDYGFLKNELRRAGHDFRATVLCTVKLSRRLFPEHRRHSLDALIERHGLQAQGRHRALADAQLIHQFWQLLRRSRPEEELAALVKELTARPNLPAQIDSSIVDDLPDGPGVYVFYGENAVPLYVGRAKDIGKRVLSHFAGDRASTRDANLARQVRRIDWTVTGGEIGAQLKEAALIRRLQPTLNRPPRHSDPLRAIAPADHGRLLAQPQPQPQPQPSRLFANSVKALAQPPPWPYAGPACIKEGDEVHVVDGWCYLGSARSADELWPLLEQGRPPFDRDVYRILAKAAARMVPLRPGSQP